VAEEPNYLAQAFKSQYNVIGLATALGFAILSGSGLPLLLAAGVEMVVLPLVSGSERFQRLVRARMHEEKQEAHQARKQVEVSEMLRALPAGEREGYQQLQGLAGEIRRNYKGLDAASRMLLEDLIRKLEFLMAFYLRMRYSVSRYEAYFSTTDPERIRERIAMLEHEISRGPQRVQEVKARTRVVLLKRLERYQKALENKQLIDAQTETVLEVLQLLRDQSYSMRDPRSITEQLDGLVASAEETERGVRDMEDILSMEQDSLLPTGVGADIETELEAGRSALPDLEPPPAATPRPRTPSPRQPAPLSPPPPPARKKITH